MTRSYVTFEKIGTCELCGATDHHLVEGVCPACRPKITTIITAPDQSARLAGYPDVPLGIEAGVPRTFPEATS